MYVVLQVCDIAMCNRQPSSYCIMTIFLLGTLSWNFGCLFCMNDIKHRRRSCNYVFLQKNNSLFCSMPFCSIILYSGPH